MSDAVQYALDSGSSRLIIVEDESAILEALGDFFTNLGFSPQLYSNAEDALKAFDTEPTNLVVTDMKLPGMDGIELCRRVRDRSDETSVIVITAFGNISSALLAIEYGAEDYLLKPFTFETLRNSFERIFEKRRLQEENRRYQQKLEDQVQSRTKAIRQASRSIGETFYKIVNVLGNSQECREPFLLGRTERVTIMSLQTAQELEWKDKQLGVVLLGAPISDIGKLAISEDILNSPDPLTQEQIELIREHVLAGERIVHSLDHFREVEPVIKHHHERLDGSGYPSGLSGSDIPAEAMLVGIVDMADAMMHRRPWRDAYPYEDVLNHIRREAGRTLESEIAHAFISAAQRHDFASLRNTKRTDLLYELTLPLLQSIALADVHSIK